MTRNEIQQKAVEEWLKFNKKGSLNLATGTGKTIASLNCLYTMPRKDGKVHLFLAETTEREIDLMSDIQLFNKLFNVDVLNDYNLKFRCYQTVYKYENYDFGLIIADEIHNSLSEEYYKFYINNKYEAIVGLSATIDRKTTYEIDGKIISKGQMLDSIAPVCFTYTLNEAKEDGIGRKLNIYVIQQQLDAVTKNVVAGNSVKKFFQTELTSYQYWDKEHKKAWFIEDETTRNLKIRITSTKRSNLLFNLPSKIKTINYLITHLKGKTILFGNSLDSLYKITNNIISSRNSDDKNKLIRENFDKNEIKLIGSFKKLRQGANLKDLDNCIIMSYYSSEGHQIQMWGRLRKNGDKVGSVFILLTKDTQEEIWFDKMIKSLEDFNFIYCDNVEECIKQYEINERKTNK